MRPSFIFFLSILFLASACKKDQQKSQKIVYDNGPTDSLKMNEVQVIASHNSYHLKTADTIFTFLKKLDSLHFLPAAYAPVGIDYAHLPFDEQFDGYNVRGLELDIYYDPQGGKFSDRRGFAIMGLPSQSGLAELSQPGFKMLHIPDFDFNTNYLTFKAGLQAIYNWSLAHPNHLPLFINIETKQDAPSSTLTTFDLTIPVPYDATACDQMDEEIKSVFGADLQNVITPDKVRGSFATLEAAALAKNWPKLADARGKVVFVMQGAAESLYKQGHPSLQGRAMFVYSLPGTDEAAFVILNEATTKKNQIIQRVGQGYIVRTRSDSDTKEARNGDYTDMNNAFAGGAQIISTDYYRADPRAGTAGWTDFHVQFPNGELARINPVSAADKQSLGTIRE